LAVNNAYYALAKLTRKYHGVAWCTSVIVTCTNCMHARILSSGLVTDLLFNPLEPKGAFAHIEGKVDLGAP